MCCYTLNFGWLRAFCCDVTGSHATGELWIPILGVDQYGFFLLLSVRIGKSFQSSGVTRRSAHFDSQIEKVINYLRYCLLITKDRRSADINPPNINSCPHDYRKSFKELQTSANFCPSRAKSSPNYILINLIPLVARLLTFDLSLVFDGPINRWRT